jgi:hypothetical protein
MRTFRVLFLSFVSSTLRCEMMRRTLVWKVAALALAMGVATSSLKAQVVTNGLTLYLDAADSQGTGANGLGSGATWVNKAPTGSTYNGDLGLAGAAAGPNWIGNGTVASPYALQLQSGPTPSSGDYVEIENSYTAGNALDSTTFTYEIWAQITGPGTAKPGGGGLMYHSTNAAGQGNGAIGYIPPASQGGLGGVGWVPATPGGDLGSIWNFPNSAGHASPDGYHQIVLTRTDGSATGTSWYLDGTLMGKFQSDSNQSADAFFDIGDRNYGGSHDIFADANVSIARVYNTALTTTQVDQNFNANAARFGLTLAHPAGDLNGDGQVNLADYTLFKSEWLQNGTGIPGDLNNDGTVNVQDFTLFKADYQQFNGLASANALVAVPEPTALLLAAISFPAWLFVRRGQRVSADHSHRA